MSQVVSVFVSGVPKGQPRPRAWARKFKSGEVMARTYDPHTAEGWKSEVAQALRGLKRAKYEGPVVVGMEFLFARPKSHLRKDGSLAKGRRQEHLGAPDCDNLAKAVLDTLTLLHVFEDDSQVVDLRLRKRYAAADEVSGMHLDIEWLETRDELRLALGDELSPAAATGAVSQAFDRLRTGRKPAPATASSDWF